MASVEYRKIEPDSGQEKWEPTSHRYFVETNSAGWSELTFVKNPEGHQEVIIGFKGGTKSNPAYVQEATSALLDNAGVPYEFKPPYGGGSNFSFSVKVEDSQALLRVLNALANDVELDHGKTHFAVIDKGVAREIAIMELERLSSEGSLDMGSFLSVNEGLQAHYVDVDFEDTVLAGVLAVSLVREDSHFHEAGPDFFTQIALSDWGAVSGIETALSSANVQYEKDKERKYLTAQGDILLVIAALVNAGALPPSFSKAVEQKVADLGADRVMTLEPAEQ